VALADRVFALTAEVDLRGKIQNRGRAFSATLFEFDAGTAGAWRVASDWGDLRGATFI
jgi:hypothetical protein